MRLLGFLQYNRSELTGTIFSETEGMELGFDYVIKITSHMMPFDRTNPHLLGQPVLPRTEVPILASLFVSKKEGADFHTYKHRSTTILAAFQDPYVKSNLRY